jgi:hypothetical protein
MKNKNYIRMEKQEYFNEHKRLLKVLKSKSHKDDLAEYKKQKEEVEEKEK